jgi:hypothetical protein
MLRGWAASVIGVTPAPSREPAGVRVERCRCPKSHQARHGSAPAAERYVCPNGPQSQLQPNLSCGATLRAPARGQRRIPSTGKFAGEHKKKRAERYRDSLSFPKPDYAAALALRGAALRPAVLRTAFLTPAFLRVVFRATGVRAVVFLREPAAFFRTVFFALDDLRAEVFLRAPDFLAAVFLAAVFLRGAALRTVFFALVDFRADVFLRAVFFAATFFAVRFTAML